MMHKRMGLLTAAMITLAAFPITAVGQDIPKRSNPGSNLVGTLGDITPPPVIEPMGTLSAGAGLVGGGNMRSDQVISMEPNQLRRQAGVTQQGVVQYTGTYPMAGSFYGGTSSPLPAHAANRLNYGGPFAASTFYATQYFYYSDARMKHDIEELDGISALNMIGRINAVSYKWNHDGNHAVGLVAQDVERTHPFLVATDENGMKSVDYTQLIAPLIAAVQELEVRNNELSARVEALEAR